MILLLILLLLTKHTIADYVLQGIRKYEYSSKGRYGSWHGVEHALTHAIGTGICFAIVGLNPFGILTYSILDGILHYHIDWLKVNINRVYGWTSKQMAYWVLFGADQYLHMLTYLLLVYLFV